MERTAKIELVAMAQEWRIPAEAYTRVVGRKLGTRSALLRERSRPRIACAGSILRRSPMGCRRELPPFGWGRP